MNRATSWLTTAFLAAALVYCAPPSILALGYPAGVAPHTAFKITSDGTPNTQFAVHNVGRISLTVSNFGTIGNGYYNSVIIDGEEALSCEYPIHSNIEYLNLGALWIGAVVGDDTLVLVGNDGWYGVTELFPAPGPSGAIRSRSNLKSHSDYDPEAVSEQDIICVYTDTMVNPGWTGEDPIDNRPHIPLHVSVTQSSYAWSYAYAEDFVIIDYQIANIGDTPIRDMFLGFYVDAAAYHKSNELTGFIDDICGFAQTVKMASGICLDRDTSDFPWMDTINVAWVADNDGDPTPDLKWDYTSTRAATGTRVLRAPNRDFSYNFNWWISDITTALDFGPRQNGTASDPFRRFGAQLGTPLGDRNKYYMMSHPEVDYDQLFTAVSHTPEGFMSPPDPHYAVDIADGQDTRYLLSFGPFDIQPGDTAPFTVAYLAGDSFHVSPGDYAAVFDPFQPENYHQTLNFDDLSLNARWASWIFDNPGIDTDGDLDSGVFCWNYIWQDTTSYNPDTSGPAFLVPIDSFKTYYRGDGLPDFKGASPPPAPVVKTFSAMGSVVLRWNGQDSETGRDQFTGQRDFEGYRVYFAQGDRETDYTLLATYDIDDFQAYRYDDFYRTYRQSGTPVTRDRLKAMYDPDFDPALYDDENHQYADTAEGVSYYFVPQDWNYSDLSDPDGIHRVYPGASPDDPADTTDDGYLRYYEYEYSIDNLQSSVPYNFSVTTFDYGAFAFGLPPLESSRLLNAVKEYPLPSATTVEREGLAVMVYPNPYRGDGGYARVGYENRDRTEAAEWAREIHFANLPKVCTIRIFTLSGDLVDEIKHDRPDGGAGSQQETWDLISRNTQAITSGIYLWQVSSEFGDQLGKLVIIK
ncbi:MAG: hypothetical protein PHR28_06370 [candidate division Zixibacteria bacterium]|nr:hypothetical protein [candidate division Zixibacteria bacterium]